VKCAPHLLYGFPGLVFGYRSCDSVESWPIPSLQDPPGGRACYENQPCFLVRESVMLSVALESNS
jgi:hypothetical protein